MPKQIPAIFPSSTSSLLHRTLLAPSPPFRRRTSTLPPRLNRLPASYYRGGTSRALIFHQRDLPADQEQWKPIFAGVLGSPDAHGRQLDGLGGGVSSLSKVCVVRSSARGDADVDYTFAAVGVRTEDVDFSASMLISFFLSRSSRSSPSLMSVTLADAQCATSF